MNKLSSLFVGGLLFLFLFTNIALSQNETSGAELYLLHEDVIKIDKVMEFEANVIKELALWKKHKMKSVIKYAAKTDDNHYYFLTPLDNYSSLDKENEYWDELMKSAGDELKEVYKGYKGMQVYHKNHIYKRLVNLSYLPEKPRLKNEEIKFIHWDNYYIKEGSMKEAKKLFIEYRNLLKSKGINGRYNVWISDIGDEIGKIVVTSYGKNAKDYYAFTSKRQEKLKGSIEKLWGKFVVLLKSFDHNNGSSMPQFVYFPEK